MLETEQNFSDKNYVYLDAIFTTNSTNLTPGLDLYQSQTYETNNIFWNIKKY